MPGPDHPFRPLDDFVEYPEEEMLRRARDFRDEIRRRRSVRHFCDRAVPREVIELCLEAAISAPSGANRQPWHFCVVSDPGVKHSIRLAAEEEERAFYDTRAPRDWLEALAPLGTDEHKPFLDTAPYLIVIFAQLHGVDEHGETLKHYYVNESVGIATGMLITALHHAGLATLTHTPSPMRFLNQILERPASERPYLILVTGYPAPDARVPVIGKKPIDRVARFVE
jgi:iodotyrosine deiodinase